MRRSLLRDLLLGCLLFLLYLVSAKLGLKVNAFSGFATLLWVPTGLSLAFLYIFGLRFWPAVALGAFLANFSSGAPFLAALGICLGNTLEAVVGVYLLKRFTKLRPRLDRMNDVLGLIFLAALFSTLISATIGATSLLLSGTIETSAYGSTWLAWWTGDVISDLVVAPMILVWSTRPRFPISRSQTLELVALGIALIAVAEVIFGDLNITQGAYHPRSYLVFPIVIWAAMRFGQRISVTAVFLIALIATWNTANGNGTFITGTSTDNLLNLLTYIGVLAASGMILAAAISERKVMAVKKDEFISVASHELKTPLTSIKAFTQTLQVIFEKKGDEESSANMGRVNRQVDRLNRLVVKLLDVSRIQEGRITLQKEKFNISHLIDEITEEIAETTYHKILIRGNTNVRVYADRDRIGRVLGNLLSNAATYSPKATKVILRVEKRRDYLIISVRDFGIGIVKKDQNQIFDRLYQADSKSAKKRPQSMGLGLYISKNIIERHRGKIWVESRKGSGSTFYFTLPL